VDLFQQILSYVLLVVVVFNAAFHSSVDIIHRMPNLLLWIFSLIVIHQIIHLMFSHITQTHFNPWGKLFLLNVIMLTGNSINFILFGYPLSLTLGPT